MNYFEEFNRIANTAEKYWSVHNKFKIALGVCLVDHEIKNAFFFKDHSIIEEISEFNQQNLIQVFLDELNLFSSDKKYTFAVDEEKKCISKTDHNLNSATSQNGNDLSKIILDHTETFLCLFGAFNGFIIYVETLENNPVNKIKMDNQHKKISEFVKNVMCLGSWITFEIQEFTADDMCSSCIHTKLIVMFKNSHLSEHKILKFIHENKLEIIDFLFSQNHFGNNTISIYPNEIEKEFTKTFESQSVKFWKKLMRGYKRVTFAF